MGEEQNQQAPAALKREAAPVRRSRRAAVISAIVVTILVVLIYQLVRTLPNPGVATEVEIAKLVTEVSAILLLPEGERPTVATVTDLAPLKGQAFFANAAIGDKVLVYAAARRAILYRPSEHKVIEVAPLTIGNSPRR